VENFLVRVALPDRPGALGAVTSRIGAVGGDVVSLEILQRDKGAVVDEFGVTLPDRESIALLEAEILEVDGVSVEIIRHREGPFIDRDGELLELAAHLVGASTLDRLARDLVGRVQTSLWTDFVALVDGETLTIVDGVGDLLPDEQLRALALSTHSPRDWSDDDPGRLGSEHVAVAAMMRAGHTVVAGRRAPVWRPRERQWIAIMVELADQAWRWVD
jgi:hypothetical protein